MTLVRLRALQEQWQNYPPLPVMFEAYIRAKAGNKIPPPKSRKRKRDSGRPDPNVYQGERLLNFIKALPGGKWSG